MKDPFNEFYFGIFKISTFFCLSVGWYHVAKHPVKFTVSDYFTIGGNLLYDVYFTTSFQDAISFHQKCKAKNKSWGISRHFQTCIDCVWCIIFATRLNWSLDSHLFVIKSVLCTEALNFYNIATRRSDWYWNFLSNVVVVYAGNLVLVLAEVWVLLWLSMYPQQAVVFCPKVIESRLGKSIHAVQDSSNPDVFYTEQHLARLRARIRGLLTAVTTPTALQRLLPATQCSEKLFMG